jgi:hypothetical protein
MASYNQKQFSIYSSKLFELIESGKTNPSYTDHQKIATDIGLDLPKFQKDFNSLEIENQIKQDQKDISEAILPISKYSSLESKANTKIQSTPTFVVLKDGKFSDSWWSVVTDYSEIQKRIKHE